MFVLISLFSLIIIVPTNTRSSIIRYFTEHLFSNLRHPLVKVLNLVPLNVSLSYYTSSLSLSWYTPLSLSLLFFLFPDKPYTSTPTLTSCCLFDTINFSPYFICLSLVCCNYIYLYSHATPVQSPSSHHIGSNAFSLKFIFILL